MSWEDRDYASGDPSRRGGGFGGFTGGGGTRFADNPLVWLMTFAPTIGHLFRIRIRVHSFLLLFMLFEFIRRPGVNTLIMEAILFGSILLHEFGHCFAARAVGGSADDILMWPLGGLASVDAPRRPLPQFITVICGPLVNVAICIVGIILIISAGGGIESALSFPYFSVHGPASGVSSTAALYYLITLDKIIWVNVALFVFNLLPMYPMDGGRMLHCALWKSMGHYKGTMITCTVGMVMAVIVGLYALFSGGAAFILLGIAIMGYLTCDRERKMTRASASPESGYMGYDFSGGYSTLDKSASKSSKPGFFARRKQEKQQGRWRAERERAAAEQLKVDAILDKVKNSGIASLTNKEKKMLEEATRRQNEADRRHGV